MTEPLAQAMVICDAIHRDSSTGKFFLLGTFSNIVVRELPAVHQKLSIFISLTDCRGKTRLRIKLVKVDHEAGDDKVIFTVDATLESRDPLQVHEIALDANGIEFAEEGEYRFILEAGGTLLLEKRIVVSRRQQSKDDSNG